MGDRPGVIGVESVQEHEDGSATYQLHMDGYAQAMLIEEGIKFILHCAAANVDIADVYDWILTQMPAEDEDIRPMTDEERQRAKEREEANSVHGRV